MGNYLQRLATKDLLALRDAIHAGRVAPPYTALALQQYCARETVSSTADQLQSFAEQGASPTLLCQIIDMLLQERHAAAKSDDSVDLVLTGPEVIGTTFRDTGVVVRELFATAERTVVIVGYAVYQGKDIFRTLAERMEQYPDLKVSMFLDIQRRHGDTTRDSVLVREFVAKFRTEHWPGKTLPDVYYDPRSLEQDKKKRSSLHAKCVVVDSSVAFVSSANFTEAAQVRNIEAGVLIRSSFQAAKLEQHFQSLAGTGQLARIIERAQPERA